VPLVEDVYARLAHEMENLISFGGKSPENEIWSNVVWKQEDS
jgi:hypothetical protein